MKKLTPLTFATVLISGAISQAAIINFTDANAAAATVDNGVLGTITAPADGATVTSVTYTITGLTIDTDGAANDTVVVTLGIAPVGAGPVTWTAATNTFGYEGEFARAGEGFTFNAITISGTSSGGEAYSLDSALYTQVTHTAWGSNDRSAITGSTTNIPDNAAETVALNDTNFTDARVANGWGIASVNFALDISSIPASVPEPTSTALLGLGGLALLSRRARK